MTSQHLCAIVRTLITHVMTSSAALVIVEILMTLRAGSDLLVTALNVDDVISHKVSEKLMTSQVAMRRHNRCRSGSVILASGEGFGNKLNAGSFYDVIQLFDDVIYPSIDVFCICSF